MSVKDDKVTFDDSSCFEELEKHSKFLEEAKKKLKEQKNK